MSDLTGKVALVTGGSRGIGAGIARRLAGDGADVAVTYLQAKEQAQQVVDDAHAAGRRGLAILADAADPQAVGHAVEQTVAEPGRLDILVNNAGILPEATANGADAPLDLALFRQTFETNVFGAVAVAQEFLPLLRESDCGRIVNISTTMGSLTDASDPDSPYYEVIVPAYQSSKGAINAITVALAKLLEDTPIKVNSICPGWVQTDLGGPDNRAAAPLTAEEAAPIVVKMATIPNDGPSGQFVDRDGNVPW
jgi:NAD(P)-dependent dehydrogenase (short-subunit alcohol dehydrogenase family)